ncbi:SDR family oxidoreductase [Carboxylicivirga sediminis]|uniref:SDR family oxidoreductase n=1 Tax=Carboxylicivirga sediminis TaxID=2006564 RepID=A0A941F6E1_9BACT|nr:SDR family oxidoreductase [Carboxylicivirga sediminis]MBR8537663.1 SDR family oxidoreductase [Carboxylicivirga sediminis]
MFEHTNVFNGNIQSNGDSKNSASFKHLSPLKERLNGFLQPQSCNYCMESTTFGYNNTNQSFMIEPTQRVLVAGATGYLGRFLVQELKNRGYWVRVLIRKEAQQSLFTDVDEFVIGQITQPDSIRGICDTTNYVISTVGITRQKDGLTYMDVDYLGNANLLAEAKQSQVKHFMYVSAINGDKLRHLKIFEAKERFVDELKASGIDYTIVRPNGFFSDMQDFLSMAKKGTVYLFGDGHYQLNPIHGEDLAHACINALETGEHEVLVGGPQILSQKELAAMALKAWNKPIKIRHLPDWTRRLSIWLLRNFTSSKIYGPYEFFLSAMAIDNVAPLHGRHRLNDYFDEVVKQS